MTRLQIGMTVIVPGIRGGYKIVEIDDGGIVVHLESIRTAESIYRHIDNIVVVR